MAQADLDLDAQKPASNKKQIILYVVIALLAVGLGVVLTLLLMKGNGAAEEAKPEEAVLEVKHAFYLPLNTMTINFSEKGPARFLQVDMQVMAYEEPVLKAIETHLPAIRNDVLFLLSSQKYEEVSTREGKEALRGQVLETIRRILEQHKVEGSIEAVYFTSFVMQ